MKRFLYLDDNPDDLSFASGGDIVGVSSLTDAAEELEKGDITDVVCDINLVGYSGFDAIKILRKKFPDVRYYITSGAFDENTLEKVKDVGIEGFIGKPVNVSKLTGE